jgi:hypothetical protein
VLRVRLMAGYYDDADRAERSPRELLLFPHGPAVRVCDEAGAVARPRQFRVRRRWQVGRHGEN